MMTSLMLTNMKSTIIGIVHLISKQIILKDSAKIHTIFQIFVSFRRSEVSRLEWSLLED